MPHLVEVTLDTAMGIGPMDEAEIPKRLGRYELMGKVASGGMATVFLGRARAAAGFERLVAIKACHPHLAEDPNCRAMFLDEARLAARIHHPNVVATIDVSEQDGLFQVMEYVEGGRVADLIASTGASGQRVAIPVALRIMADALLGLQAAHEAKDPRGRPLNLVHRDISPQNILVGVDGVTRVADFGIAKAEARAGVTTNGEIKGKLPYMAPEQLSGGIATHRSDIYAAGLVLWELLVGERLVKGASNEGLIQQILFRPFIPPSTLNPEVSPKLDDILARALHSQPSARYPSAQSFAEALESYGELASQRSVAESVARWLDDTVQRRRLLAQGQPATTGMTEECLPVTSIRPAAVARDRRHPWVSRWVLSGLFLGAVGALGWTFGVWATTGVSSEGPGSRPLRVGVEAATTEGLALVPTAKHLAPVTDKAEMSQEEHTTDPREEATARPEVTRRSKARRRTRSQRRHRRPHRRATPVRTTAGEFTPDFL